MKKLGYFLVLLIILSACTAGPAQKPADDLSASAAQADQQLVDDSSISASGADQTMTGSDVKADIQPSSVSAQAGDPVFAAQPALTVTQTGEALTPFQLHLQEAIKQRKAAGLPVPSVTYEYQSSSQDAWKSIMGDVAPQGSVIVTSRTIIQFAGPEQAGYEQWPALTYNKVNSSGAGGTIKVDYTEAYRQYMEQKAPGIWNAYEFGHEPRNHTIVETFQIIYPEKKALGSTSSLDAQLTSAEDILMGFTYTGPKIDLSIEDSLDIFGVEIYDFKAGLDLDWAFGLRLPAAVNLTGPDQLVLGSPFSPASALTPLDWTAANYSNFGVASEDGNEFVGRFNYFIGIKGEILGQDLCELIFGFKCSDEKNTKVSRSFTTPFGAGSSFPISDFSETISIIDLGLIKWDITFLLQPKIGSDKITADWQASGDASGSGQITYSSPGSPISFGPINACNLGSGNQAQVKLSNFQYFFNQFAIEFKITNKITIDVGFDDYSFEEPVTLNIDLSSIFGGLGLQVGGHMQCDALFNCTAQGPDNTLNLSIPVVDLNPPTTSLSVVDNAGNHGWYVSDVQVTLNATDLPAGCGSAVKQTEYSFDGVSWNAYAGPFTISTEGITTVYYRSLDNEGNVEPANSQAIKIDKTPPTITGAATTTPNIYGWYNTDVVVHFDAADATSGIDTVTPDQALSGEGANQTVTGTAVDVAGLTASFTVTGINIDKTQPTLSITSPEARVYENTETLNVIWTASDGLSGMASESGTVDGVAVTNGQLIDLLILVPGQHTVTVEATDKAGNTTSTSVVFSVSVDAEGLLAALEHMCELGWIDKHGICNSLAAKLEASIQSIEKGNLNAAENQLNAFLHELEAQKDKSINETAYEVLQSGAVFVIDHLQ